MQKISTKPAVPLENQADLVRYYTPGVAEECRAIVQNPQAVFALTSKRNSVAVVTDGSAVLGLGDIGPEAALPVMEGKCALFQRFAGVDAWPICLNVHGVSEIVEAVSALAPGFGGINLEDIAAPKCFEVERRLQERLDIPVVHDDQHATAVVVLAGLLNALKVVGKNLRDARVVLSGAGAAGIAIADLLIAARMHETSHGSAGNAGGGDDGDAAGSGAAGDIILTDRHGAIFEGRENLNPEKLLMAAKTNRERVSGSLADVIKNADVFIGVSSGGLVSSEMVASMAKDAIVFALANPDPEIMPDAARAGGAAVVATGRSDFPNQLNNVLVFPGLFRGALDARRDDLHAHKRWQFTNEMFLRAAKSLASLIEVPKPDMIIPNVFDEWVVPTIAKSVMGDALNNT